MDHQGNTMDTVVSILDRYTHADQKYSASLALKNLFIRTKSLIALALLQGLAEDPEVESALCFESSSVKLILALPLQHPLSGYELLPNTNFRSLSLLIQEQCPNILIIDALSMDDAEDQSDLLQCVNTSREKDYLRLALKHHISGNGNRRDSYLRGLMEWGVTSSSAKIVKEFMQSESRWSPHHQPLVYMEDMINIIAMDVRNHFDIALFYFMTKKSHVMYDDTMSENYRGMVKSRVLAFLDFLSDNYSFISMRKVRSSSMTPGEKELMFDARGMVFQTHFFLSLEQGRYTSKELAMYAASSRLLLPLKTEKIGIKCVVRQGMLQLIKSLIPFFNGDISKSSCFQMPNLIANLPGYFGFKAEEMNMIDVVSAWKESRLLSELQPALIALFVGLYTKNTGVVNSVENGVYVKLLKYYQNAEHKYLWDPIVLFSNIIRLDQDYLYKNKNNIIPCYEFFLNMLRSDVESDHPVQCVSDYLASMIVLWPYTLYDITKYMKLFNNPIGIHAHAVGPPEMPDGMIESMMALLLNKGVSDENIISLYGFLYVYKEQLHDVKQLYFDQLLIAMRRSESFDVLMKLQHLYEHGLGPISQDHRACAQISIDYSRDYLSKYADNHAASFDGDGFCKMVYLCSKEPPHMIGSSYSLWGVLEEKWQKSVDNGSMKYIFFKMAVAELWVEGCLDDAKSFVHLKKAALGKLPEALWLLSFLYWTGGHGYQSDFSKSLKIIRFFDHNVVTSGLASWFEKSMSALSCLLPKRAHIELVESVSNMAAQVESEAMEQQSMSLFDTMVPSASLRPDIKAVVYGQPLLKDSMHVVSEYAPLSVFNVTSLEGNAVREVHQNQEWRQENILQENFDSDGESESCNHGNIRDEAARFSGRMSIEAQMKNIAEMSNLYMHRTNMRGSRFRLDFISGDGEQVARFCAHELHGPSKEKSHHKLAKRIQTFKKALMNDLPHRSNAPSLSPK